MIKKKSEKRIEEIRSVIQNIKRNNYSSPDKIKLQKSLFILEDEIREMFIKNKEAIEYLKKLERMRTEFLANVSHELRTPIFAVQGYIETLLNGAINDEKVNKYFLEKANTHTISLSNLLNDLIDISMIESGEMRMSFRYFNIGEYLSGLINDFIPLANSKNLELIFHPVRKNLKLYGDKNRLKQVITNLLENAIKYTESGSIEVIVEEEDRTGKIIIKDSGIGIAPEDKERIFERFYRVDKARSKDVGGTGLGLAIVKHIVEAHGSKIELQSEIGTGSTFFFRLKK
ncbi:MAG TPA: ATP-binding protein [Ignavibacteriaceae bacterium]|mgnify:CR=1 FL=1|nr:ATP-binding protein [Ignavibacteriaceae bacterium]